MRVINFAVDRSKTTTTFSADFIFLPPFAGWRDATRFYFRRVMHPGDMLRHGLSTRHKVWFRIPHAYSRSGPYEDAFFLPAAVMALALKQDLQFDAMVPKKSLQKMDKLRQYFAEIALRSVRVTHDGIRNGQPKKKQVGQFFTLGVDSFYTLLCYPNSKHSKYLIYVDGYDIPLNASRLLNTVHKRISVVASKTHTTPVFVQTNLRDLSDEIINWGRFHVCALAAAGGLMSFGKIYISGESFEAPDWGMKFGVDKLLSTNTLAFELVGHNMTRDVKIRRLHMSRLFPLFLKHVRVCWRNIQVHGMPYNCSNCQKCIKTKLMLDVLAKHKPTPTFKDVNIRALRKITLVEHVQHEWKILHGMLKRQHGTDPNILNAVAHVLAKPLRR